MFTVTYVHGNYLVRAIAISFVVANHSSWLSLGGGMNFLLLLAGYNLASFTFSKNNHEIIRDMMRMVLKIILPTVAIIIVYACYYQQFNWKEITLMSYLLPNEEEQVSKIPYWYCQALLFMCLMLIPFILITNFSKLVKLTPIYSTLSILCITVCINLVSTLEYPWERLPHLFLWNFTLGWAVWALLNKPTFNNKLKASALVIIVAGLIFTQNLDDFPFLIYRFAIFTLFTLIFIWLRGITLPSLLGTAINITANATLFLFLFHMSFITLYDHLWLSPENDKMDMIFRFSFAMLSSIVFWVFYESTTNTIKRYRKI